MASTDGKGYLIPEDPSPPEMGCILVFYPEDSQNYYLRALVGSLSYLGTWTAWERDPDRRGRLAAAAWKSANDCTFSSMSCVTDLVNALTGINDTLALIRAAIENQAISLDASELVTAVNGVQAAIENQQINLDPSGLLPALAGIEEAIEGIECGGGINEEDMSIVINNCCCSGSGGSSGTAPDGTLPPDLPPDDDLPMPPEQNEDNPQPEDFPVTDTECAGIAYVFYQWRTLCIAIANGEVTRTNLLPRLSSSLPYHSLTWAVSGASMLLYMSLYLSGLAGYGGQTASEIDSKAQALKCILYSRSTSATKAEQGKIIIGTMSLPFILKALIKILWQYLPFGGLAQNGGIYEPFLESVAPWAFNVGCPDCGQDDEEDNTGGLADAPDGFKWVPITNGISATNYTMQYMGDGEWARQDSQPVTYDMYLNNNNSRTTEPYPRAVAVYYPEGDGNIPVTWVSGLGNPPAPPNDVYQPGTGIILNMQGVLLDIPDNWYMHSITPAQSTRARWQTTTGGIVRFKLWALMPITYAYEYWSQV